MKYADTYKQAIDRWGIEKQMDMAVEECAELIQAVNKVKRATNAIDTNKRIEELIGEIADVLNTVEQLQFFFGPSTVDSIRESKIERLKKRLSQ